jgi:FAD/FMN-containing dehydrogenase
MKKKYSQIANEAANPLRNLTPGGGTYFNEADVLEPDWRVSFWGPNYDRLMEIKQKYDPTNFFHCWKCLGWDESMASKDQKYKCYQY